MSWKAICNGKTTKTKLKKDEEKDLFPKWKQN